MHIHINIPAQMAENSSPTTTTAQTLDAGAAPTTLGDTNQPVTHAAIPAGIDAGSAPNSEGTTTVFDTTQTSVVRHGETFINAGPAPVA